MTDDVERRFSGAMEDIYRRAKAEAHYNAVRFHQMLGEHGAIETARLLIHAAAPSDGYTALWERGRLDLTVEAMIIDNPQWHPLFTDEELATARRRLEEYEYEFRE